MDPDVSMEDDEEEEEEEQPVVKGASGSKEDSGNNAQWSGTVKNQDVSTGLLGHSLVRSFVCSHRSLTRLLSPTCFARILRCARLFARSLTPKFVGKYTI